MSKPDCSSTARGLRPFYIIPLALLSTFVLTLFFPANAYAIDLFPDVGSIVSDLLVDNILAPMCEGLLNQYLSFIQNISIGGILTASFDDIFGNTGGTSLYEIVNDVHDSVVVPLAHSILALVMLVQVVKISQRIDATSTMPALKEVIFLAVFFVIFTWLINQSAEICKAVYDTVNQLTVAIGDPEELTLSIELGDTEGVTIGTVAGLFLFLILGWILGFVAWVVCFVMTYFRALQLYIYTTFSPIPFAFMGFEETRSFGVNFCKNFIAVCLAGCIMAFALIAFPALASGVVTDTPSLIPSFMNDTMQGMVVFVKLVAISIVLIFVMIKSGSMARDILGG